MFNISGLKARRTCFLKMADLWLPRKSVYFSSVYLAKFLSKYCVEQMCLGIGLTELLIAFDLRYHPEKIQEIFFLPPGKKKRKSL